MAERIIIVGIAYRDQPGIRVARRGYSDTPYVLTKEGVGLSVEAFRDWLWDNQGNWVKITLQAFDAGEPSDG